MSHLSLVSTTTRPPEPPAAVQPGIAQMAHDIRNALTTIGLHLETLERLAGTAGAKAAGAGHALVAKAATLCSLAITTETGSGGRTRRTAIDIAQVARDVVALLEATMPAGLEVGIESDGRVMALADANAAFRILFNLVNNAVTVARTNARLRKLNVGITRDATMVVVRVADDGPGLPAAVRKALFKPAEGTPSGQGLAIVRELVERAGGSIRLEPTARGTTFAVLLPAFASMLTRESPVTRSLGRRSS